MAARRCRILLSEGSSLSARETATVLGLAGFGVEVVSSDPMCLARFWRYVARIHPAPASGSDPDGYLAAVLEVISLGAARSTSSCPFTNRPIFSPPRAIGCRPRSASRSRISPRSNVFRAKRR